MWIFYNTFFESNNFEHCHLNSSSSSEASNLLKPGKQPDCYNGAVLDRYTWSQTIKDIDLKIPVPKCVKRARDVAVEIKTSSLRVTLKGTVPPEGRLNKNLLVNQLEVTLLL